MEHLEIEGGGGRRLSGETAAGIELVIIGTLQTLGGGRTRALAARGVAGETGLVLAEEASESRRGSTRQRAVRALPPHSETQQQWHRVHNCHRYCRACTQGQCSLDMKRRITSDARTSGEVGEMRIKNDTVWNAGLGTIVGREQEEAIFTGHALVVCAASALWKLSKHEGTTIKLIRI